MKVWVSHNGDSVPTAYLTHSDGAPDAAAREETLVGLPVLGSESKRLVDRADLETAIVDRTAADGSGLVALCHWPGCEFYETRSAHAAAWTSLKPHSACCPLAEVP